jgi:hypothetical protein
MKHIKIILVTIFLTLALAAYGQQNDDLLELEDIIVLGKSQGFTDSLQAVPEDFSYTRKSDLSDFAYIPKLQTFSVYQNHASTLAEDQFIWHLQGGSESIINSRLGYNSNKSTLLKFEAEYYNEEYQTDWLNNTLFFAWLPEYKQHQAIFSYQRELYELDEGSTQYDAGQVLIPNWKLDLARNGKAEIDATFSYTDWQQEMDNNETENLVDLDAGLGINWQKNCLRAGLTADYLAEEFIMQTWLTKDDLLIDQLGLWLAVDQNQLAASLKYSHSISLGKDFSLLLKNEPYLGKYKRRQFLQDNHYLDIATNFRQENIPINHSLCWQYNGRVQTAFRLNSKYVLNRMNYVLVQQLDEWSDLYYEPQYLDIWENELFLSINWQWENLSCQHLASYTFYGEIINYAPLLECRNDLYYQYQKLNASLSLEYNTGRKDISHTYLKDAFLLDMAIGYQLSRNLILTVKAANIADTEYQKYDLSAEEKLSILGGFELSF